MHRYTFSVLKYCRLAHFFTPCPHESEIVYSENHGALIAVSVRELPLPCANCRFRALYGNTEMAISKYSEIRKWQQGMLELEKV